MGTPTLKMDCIIPWTRIPHCEKGKRETGYKYLGLFSWYRDEILNKSNIWKKGFTVAHSPLYRVSPVA